MIIKVMTYNIMHGLDYALLKQGERAVNLERISEIILDNNPDIININEIYSKPMNNIDDEYFDHLKYLKDLVNYPYAYFSKAIENRHGSYGNAIISKYPLDDIKIFDVEDPKNVCSHQLEHRVITSFRYKSINIIGTHFGLVKGEQENALKLLKNIIKDDEQIIFMGDLNMTCDNEIIKDISNILKDSINEGFTFPSINPERKIDYIFYNNIKLKEAKIIERVASDHFPVLAIFEVN